MSLPQRRAKAILILKILNVIIGILNAILSIGLACITLLIILVCTAYGVSLLNSLILILMFILIMCVSKLCFDFIFIYSVVKERLMVIKLYCYLTVVLCILLTSFMIIVGYETIDASTRIWIILYSLNISTILLSYFYEQICSTEDFTTHKV